MIFIRHISTYDCKLKRHTILSKSKRTYIFYDKTVDAYNIFGLPQAVDEIGLQDEAADFESIQSLSQLFQKNPQGLAYKSVPILDKDFLGFEIVNSYKCHHYKHDASDRVKIESWYSPELNCCVKYAGKAFEGSSVYTLYSYSYKIDTSVFDISKYRHVTPTEFYKKD